MSETCAGVIIVLVTLLFPPAGVFFIGGCSADLFINVLLTILGYFPGHIHAFYTLWVYYEAKSRGHEGRRRARKPPGIFSQRILNGGERYVYPEQQPPTQQTYGTSTTSAPATNGVQQPV
ncbi:Stress response RCI peptide [Trichophyton interdigitale]|uniref:Stress response RCI peptide n=2 Tax=Trichophyton interdigitale TaxID=101480 RepID=A0A9P5CX62_9EURO|nr:Stress response RCI peptide [Trichophyton interdigitale]KAF3901002.1 Stress response RCI peptide [Trichophyton interdigitale]KAG8207272.1 Stress response RCI peptide [Trichophyton interdigitale]KDB24742.1 hypothetical protein H109_03374 [Trichophyton interdigitale MR816]